VCVCVYVCAFVQVLCCLFHLFLRPATAGRTAKVVDVGSHAHPRTHDTCTTHTTHTRHTRHMHNTTHTHKRTNTRAHAHTHNIHTNSHKYINTHTKHTHAYEGSNGASKQISEAVVLEVGGMKCGGCSAAVKRMLVARPDVESAAVNLLTETAAVRFRCVCLCDCLWVWVWV